MARIALGLVLCVTALVVAASGSSRPGLKTAGPTPCSTSKIGGATVLNWCGPAKATVKLAGKNLSFVGGVCGVSPGFDGKAALSVNVGKFTTPPAKPKSSYFGITGKPKAGTYAQGEHVISFQLPGKAYSLQGGPAWGLPWPKVTITAGGKKGTFSGHAFLGAAAKGTPVSGSWSC